jgi:hypothetical protein
MARMNIQLATQDMFDNTDKVGELRSAIGKEFSDNHSSTLRSVLVSVSDDGNRVTTREVPNQYGKAITPKPGTQEQPSWLVWNAMFS